MGKSSRAYRSAKRGKELKRLQKQEEKRKRRIARKDGEGKGPPIEGLEPEEGAVETEAPAEQAPEEKPEESQ